MVDLIGWASSLVLVATIAKQVHKQWSAGSSDGVSRWLFVGQVVASLGFTVYSVLVGNRVFVVTNAILLANALLGLVIVLRHRRARAAGAPPPAGTSRAGPRDARTA